MLKRNNIKNEDIVDFLDDAIYLSNKKWLLEKYNNKQKVDCLKELCKKFSPINNAIKYNEVGKEKFNNFKKNVK